MTPTHDWNPDKGDKRSVLNGKPITGGSYPSWTPPRSQVWLSRFGWATIAVAVAACGFFVWVALSK